MPCHFCIYYMFITSIVSSIHQSQQNKISQLYNNGIKSRNIPPPGKALLSWVVELRNDLIRDGNSEKIIKVIAHHLDLHNFGVVGSLHGHYCLAYIPPILRHKSHLYSVIDLHDIQTRYITNPSLLVEEIEHKLSSSTQVLSFHREIVLSRKKRHITFEDPKYPKQWHLVNRRIKGHDINVTGVWERNVTGKGVTVAVLDDGLQWNNTDIYANYNPHGSTDLNDGDRDPMPSFDKEANHHGTRCAGEIAGVANTVCGVGVAYGARVAGIRILAGPMTDSMEAVAFNKYNQINHIFSCSWGPDDNGRTVDGPHHLAVKAMRYGVDFGRRGYGSIYVVASGNGGAKGDNCNYDGYANSLYTITIGAVDEWERVAYYSETCASMMAVTYSSGGAMDRTIVTTDWTLMSGTGCTERHSGTSAAAPIAAGLIALMLEVQPCLTWRDVQYIIAFTAAQVGHSWMLNQAGLKHSHETGFGLLKAWRLVNAAKVWQSVPFMTSYSTNEIVVNSYIPFGGTPLVLTTNVTGADLRGYLLTSLEHIQVTVTIRHGRRGNLNISLVCPGGTASVIAAPRARDDSTDGFDGWTFSTVRCWGEQPHGVWRLIISDRSRSGDKGEVIKYRLHLYGTYLSETDFQSRRAVVEAAMSGVYLNDSYRPPCSPPPTNPLPETEPMTEWTVKLLLVLSVLAFALGIYETIEYMVCYSSEKTEQRRTTRSAQRAAQVTHRYTALQQDEEPLLGDEESMEMTTLGARPLVHDDSNSYSATIYSNNVVNDATNDALNDAMNTAGGGNHCSVSADVSTHHADTRALFDINVNPDRFAAMDSSNNEDSDWSFHVDDRSLQHNSRDPCRSHNPSTKTAGTTKDFKVGKTCSDRDSLRELLHGVSEGIIPTHMLDVLTVDELRLNLGMQRAVASQGCVAPGDKG